MRHYWPNVPGLGNVAFSRHALAKVGEAGLSEKQVTSALIEGIDVPDGIGVVRREKNGVRLVILEKPEPFKGAKLVKTIYFVEEQARAK